eukprot:GHVS01057781.1.p3 GENE.GHVS01057781.1~~GHVS01057781.1.p3  ORF type:complete len:156 (+),score=17.85 GHVS01057781.1:1074-1541(+)
MYLFIAAWDISWAGLMFVVASEILPSAIRGVGMGLSIFAFWLALFVTEISFQSMWVAMTIPGTFAFYACMTALVLVFVYVYVPETKGESLEEITEKFRLKRDPPSTQLHTMNTLGSVSTMIGGSTKMTESSSGPVSPTTYGKQLMGRGDRLESDC